MVRAAAISTVELMKFLDVDGLGQVSRIGLGTWQFGSPEWGYGDDYAAGPARDIVDRARALGVTVPIVPGIMPIHNYARIAQFAQRDGIEIPRWVALKMEGFMDDVASIRAFGLDVVTQACERLIAGGVPGITRSDTECQPMICAPRSAALLIALSSR